MSFNNQISGVNNTAGEAGVAMLSIAKNDKAFKEMLRGNDDSLYFCVNNGRFASFAYLDGGCVIRSDDFSVSYDSVFYRHNCGVIKKAFSATGLTMDEFGTINGVFKPNIEEAFGYEEIRNLIGNYEEAPIIGAFIPSKMKPMSFLKCFIDTKGQIFCNVFSIQGTEEVGSDEYYRANVYATDTKRIIKFDAGAFKFLNANEKFYIPANTLATLCTIFEKSGVVCIQKFKRGDGAFYIFSDNQSKYALITFCLDGNKTPDYDRVLSKNSVSDDKTSFKINDSASLQSFVNSAMGDVLFEYKDDELYISDFINDTVCNKQKIGIEVISRTKEASKGIPYPNENFLFDKKFLLSLLKNGNKLTLSINGWDTQYCRTVFFKLDDMDGAYLSKAF